MIIVIKKIKVYLLKTIYCFVKLFIFLNLIKNKYSNILGIEPTNSADIAINRGIEIIKRSLNFYLAKNISLCPPKGFGDDPPLSLEYSIGSPYWSQSGCAVLCLNVGLASQPGKATDTTQRKQHKGLSKRLTPFRRPLNKKRHKKQR